MKVVNVVGIYLILLLGVNACKVAQEPGVVLETSKKTGLPSDSLQVLKEEPPIELKLYRGERTRHFKLNHTKLDVSFDWSKQLVHGKATLTLEPYFYEQSDLLLDAKGFDIHELTLINGDKREMLNYEYNGEQIYIDLERDIMRGQQIHLYISYTAAPNAEMLPDENDDTKKGLYFINPLNLHEEKPMQIWTHGETDTNSRWFPTIDAPNQKTTQELYITVDKKFTTLSNGKLIFSRANADSTRTDYWKMDKPHAPYLLMLAVGEFSVHKEQWNGLEVDYYTEEDFGPYAGSVFGNTPEMLSFFSEILGYPYPWDKYSQVVVRDFVSGAMENTTASVFMEDLNVTDRELIDYNWDDIIAHELFHQWFGNLVTCESWANLPLNESFATYGEFLWKDHKYGRDEAAYHLHEELNTYLAEAETKKEDLIRFYYDDSDDMFDSHSYAKGGLILHLLRDYLGDEAFFKSLEYYLKRHAFGKAEVHELRLAFEHVSGEDLNWFFNQWFLASGHPELRVEEVVEDGKFKVKIWQDQDMDLYPVFRLPLTLDLWEEGELSQYIIEVDLPYQEFEFEDVGDPELVLVDSDYVLVGEMDHPKTAAQLLYQYEKYDSNIHARIAAMEYFTENPEDSLSPYIISQALEDPFWVIREEALAAIEQDSTDWFKRNESVIAEIADTDPNPLVQAGAIAVLAEKNIEGYAELFKSHLYDSSYSVAGQALYAYLQLEAADIQEVLSAFEEETNFNITSTVADYYIRQQDHEQFSWFSDKLRKYNSAELWYFIKLFGMYLVTAPEDMVTKGAMELELIALNHNQFYNRLSAYQSLELLSDHEGVPEILENIRSKEKDSRLRDYFDQ